MDTVDEIDSSQDKEPISRWDRLRQWLLPTDGEPTARLDALRRYHRLRISALDQEAVWDSTFDKSIDSIQQLASKSRTSPLGEAMQTVYRSYGLGDRPADEVGASNASPLDAIVIVSDGQSNGTISPLDLVAQASVQKVPILAIGLGKTTEPVDLAVLSADISKSIRREDRLRGTLRMKEQIPDGTEYQVKVKNQGNAIFERKLVGNGRGVFEFDFDVPAAALLDRAIASTRMAGDRRAIPIDLECVVESQMAEAKDENNAIVTSTWGLLRESRALMLDPRGRWETRYIRNALDRDPAWELVSFLGQSSFEGSFFPETRAELFRFDLVIATADIQEKLNAEQRKWLSDFVSDSGGGLIWIEGTRSSTQTDETLSELLPFRSIPNSNPGTESTSNSLHPQMRLTAVGLGQAAFQLETEAGSNQQIWQSLPGPRAARRLEAKPGCEVLAEFQQGSTWYPMIGTSLVGQGRVVALASDETWRWRYNVADLYHQRFWNQLANWGMRAPFVVSDTFASLDAGKRVYPSNETVLVRARLLTNDQQPLVDGTVHAVFSQQGKRLASLPLTEQSGGAGIYTGELKDLMEWSRLADFDADREVTVQLEAVGIPSEALRLSTSFFVERAMDIESTTLGCNVELLQQLAEKTGGKFLRIEQADKLEDLLESHRKGTLREEDWYLWQSYVWFVSIMIVLGLEWFLRKRHGLV